MTLFIPDFPFRLHGARVPAGTFEVADRGPEAVPQRDRDGAALLDIDVSAAGAIACVSPVDSRPVPDDASVVFLDGRQVWPGFIDAHAHLDKAHTWNRAPNPDGTLIGARGAAKRDRAYGWSYDDVYRRMDFAVRTAWVHGTTAIRTHLDSQEGRTEPSWSAFLALRKAWEGRMVLQGTLTLGIAKLAGAWGETVANWAASHGLALGPVVYDGPDVQSQINRAFDLAQGHRLDLDFHVDETDDPQSDGLTRIADTALSRGFSGRILCSHACSLSRRPDDRARATIAKLVVARIGIVSLPMTNIYLQDRRPFGTPRWRGITLLRELKAAGLPVALAGDNVRDAFHPYGDHDLLDVFRDAVRLGHLDLPIGDWPRAVTASAADLLDLPRQGRLVAGAPADLVIFEGRDYTEVLSRHGRGRVVLRAGRALVEPLPDYRELDL